jgi:hypothetical protein
VTYGQSPTERLSHEDANVETEGQDHGAGEKLIGPTLGRESSAGTENTLALTKSGRRVGASL